MKLIAFFPGQGAQTVGMGKELFDHFAVVRETFEEASDSIRIDIKKLCFTGPESDLTLTENTQPCLLTASVAAFRVAEAEMGFAPLIAAGHSLGEYSALVAAHALKLSVAVKWARERGLAMQKAVPPGQGTMAAVMGLGDSEVTRLCETATENAKLMRGKRPDSEFTVQAIVEPANFNAPGQVVIAGSTDAVDEAVNLVKAGSAGGFPGGKAIPLQVSAPFHCRLMEPARSRMAELFAQADPLEKPEFPRFPYVPNHTARISREQGLIFEFLIEQVDHPVLWRQSVQHLLEQGYRDGVEFGPGKVLTGLAKRVANQVGKNARFANVSDLVSLKNLRGFLNDSGRQEMNL